MRAGGATAAVLAAISAIAFNGCLPSSTSADTHASSGTVLQTVEGIASYYSDTFEGRPTASGEPYHASELTAAHRDWPFGTKVRVTNLDGGRSVVVRINDRGPNASGRLIDLSRSAAEAITMVQAGTARVRLEVLAWGD